MSYILEALKKSEQDRQIGQVPDLSVIQENPVRAMPRWPRWLLAALVLNIAILAVLAWRVWDARVPATVASAPSAPAEMQPDPAAVNPASELDTRIAAPSPAVAVPAPDLPVPVSEMPSPPAERLPPVSSEQTAAEAQMQLGPDLEVLPPVGAIDAAVGVPRWEDLSAEQRAGLPEPRIDVHVFAQEPERRFVLIDLRKYRQGDTLDDGPVIEAILADGIVLSYQGQKYRVDRP